ACADRGRTAEAAQHLARAQKIVAQRLGERSVRARLQTDQMTRFRDARAFCRPPFSWIAVFVAVSYLMGVACVYHALRVFGEEGWSSGFREIAIFLVFCGLGYFVESWAHARTPYYVYATECPDRLPRLPVENWSGLFRVPRTTKCAT